MSPCKIGSRNTARILTGDGGLSFTDGTVIIDGETVTGIPNTSTHSLME